MSLVTDAFVDLVKEAKFHEERFLFWPDRWGKYVALRTDPVSWAIVKFDRQEARNVPNVPGVYAFLIKPGIPLGLEHAILIYVGKADKSIRSRYYKYLKDASPPYKGRPVLAIWLHRYRNFLYFASAEVKRPGKPSLTEKRLLAALTPPINQQLPAEVRRVSNAFR